MAHENLYDSLSYNIPDADLSQEEKRKLTETIAGFDIEKKEIVYMLIMRHWSKASPSTKVIFPYKSKQVTNDRLEIKVDAMPVKLKRILYKFCRLAEVSANDDPEVQDQSG